LHNVPDSGFVDEATTAEQLAMFEISIENSTVLRSLCATAGSEGVLFSFRYRLYKFTYYSSREVIATFAKYL
jgi:hypothetical protein